MRAAAISVRFLGKGLHNFLMLTFEFDGNEVVEALETTGAIMAANHLRRVLAELGVAVPFESAEARAERLDSHWTEALDELAFLSREAEDQLMTVLGRHVAESETHYLALGLPASEA